MARHRLADPRILVDGEPLAGVATELAHFGAYDLTIHTDIPPLALEVQTSVLGHPASETSVAHVVIAPGGTRLVDAEPSPPGGLCGDLARAARLLEHYACVRAAIEELTGALVALELADVALAAAARR